MSSSFPGHQNFNQSDGIQRGVYASVPEGKNAFVSGDGELNAFMEFVLAAGLVGDAAVGLPLLSMVGDGHSIEIANRDAAFNIVLAVASGDSVKGQLIEGDAAELTVIPGQTVTIRRVSQAIASPNTFWRVTSESYYPAVNPAGPTIIMIDVSAGDAEALLPELADVAEGAQFRILTIGVGTFVPPGIPTIAAAVADQGSLPLDGWPKNNLSALVPQSISYQKVTIGGTPVWKGYGMENSYGAGISGSGASPDVQSASYAHVQERSEAGNGVATGGAGFFDWTTGGVVDARGEPYIEVTGSGVTLHNLGAGLYEVEARAVLAAPATSKVSQRVVQGPVMKVEIPGTATVTQTGNVGARMEFKSKAYVALSTMAAENPIAIQWASDEAGGAGITIFEVDLRVSRVGV